MSATLTDMNDLALVRGLGAVRHSVEAALPPDGPANEDDEEAGSVKFTEVEVADLGSAVLSPQAWWWTGYLPAGQVTLLAGHGGVGKSLLALMLAVSVAMQRNFLGQDTQRGKVLFFSAEDGSAVVRLRLTKICRAWGVDPAKLASTLRVIDATEIDAALYSERRVAGVRAGAVTPTYTALREYLGVNGIDVLILDNASDVFDGDEIVRTLVRGFIRSLAALVRRSGGGVVLLAHVDKTTSRAGKGATSESYSGSTAWHNSVRSRLFLQQREPGLLELQHQKSNHGTLHKPVQLAWPEGQSLPYLVEAPADSAPPAERSEADEVRALVGLVRDYYRRGEWVSTSLQSNSSASRLFSNEGDYPRYLKASEVVQRLRTAERLGYLHRESYKGQDRKARERWAVPFRGHELLDGPTMFDTENGETA